MKERYPEIRAKTLAYQKTYREENSDKIKVRDKRYREENKEKIRAYYRKWYAKSGRGRSDNYRDAICEYKQMFPERVAINRQLRTAVQNGEIKPPASCPRCHRKSRLSAHHVNYDHYLNFVWLCSSCHKIEHGKIKNNLS